MNSYYVLSSLLDASGKSLLKEIGIGCMLSPIVAYTSSIIMQAIPARVIGTQVPLTKMTNIDSVTREWIHQLSMGSINRD